jgi:hypothetical protein
MKALAYLFMAAGVATAGALLWQGRELPRAFQDEGRRAADLRAVQEALSFRHEARREILEDVVAGRMTLLQAADQFKGLNERHPESMTAVRFTYDGGTDEERLCRQVIAGVQGLLDDRPPSEAAPIIARLEAELHDHFGEGAGVS